jgi:GDP-mannose 6-dehydrogenase
VRILIWGLGCPGLVSAACFAQLGHDVVGIDVDETKVSAINSGRSPFQEPGLTPLLQEAVGRRRLRALSASRDCVQNAEVSFISVGTPSTCAGVLDTSRVESVVETIAYELRGKTHFHQIILRSTVFPGFTRSVLAPRLEKISGFRIGKDVALAVCPEFLREGNALEDFRGAPFSALGTIESRSAEMISELARSLLGEVVQMSAEEAEMLKLANNAFHALKIGFANEIGRLCAACGVNPKKLMTLVCRDTRLNTSPAYLSPGFPFGGPCLSKDLAAITSHASSTGATLPILESVLPSNEEHFEACVRAIRATGLRDVGILGLAFKPGTDDLRNSPSLRLAAYLHREGFCVRVYDRDVQAGSLSESNRRALDDLLPDYGQTLLPNLEALLGSSSLVVITQRRPEFALTADVLKDYDVKLLDLADPT